MKILIDKDIYNICSRIKKFDKNYILIYDTDISKYKVYSSQINGVSETICNKKLSYVCTLPFDELDMRTIKYLYDTRIENIEMIINLLQSNVKSACIWQVLEFLLIFLHTYVIILYDILLCENILEVKR